MKSTWIKKIWRLNIILSILSIAQPTYAKEVETLNLKYFGEMQHSLRLMLVGGNDDMRANLKSMDTRGIIDHDFRPATLDETDLIVVFLNSWDDADLLGEGWGFLKQSLKPVPKENLQFFGINTVRDNVTLEERAMAVIVFSLNNINNKEYRCFSTDIINRLTLENEEYEKNNIATCK